MIGIILKIFFLTSISDRVVCSDIFVTCRNTFLCYCVNSIIFNIDYSNRISDIQSLREFCSVCINMSRSSSRECCCYALRTIFRVINTVVDTVVNCILCTVRSHLNRKRISISILHRDLNSERIKVHRIAIVSNNSLSAIVIYFDYLLGDVDTTFQGVRGRKRIHVIN